MNAKRLLVVLFLLGVGFSLSCLSIEDYASSYPTKMMLREGQNIEVSLYAFVDGDFKPVKNAIIFVEKYGSKGLESICKANTDANGRVVIPKDSDESKYYKFIFCYYDPAKDCAFKECLSEVQINSIDDVKDCEGFSVNKEKATVEGKEIRLRPAIVSTSTTISRQVGLNVTNLSVCFPLIIALGTIIGVMLMTGNNPFIWFSFDMLRNPRLVRPSNIKAGFAEAGVRRKRFSTAEKLFMAGKAAVEMEKGKKKVKATSTNEDNKKKEQSKFGRAIKSVGRYVGKALKLPVKGPTKLAAAVSGLLVKGTGIQDKIAKLETKGHRRTFKQSLKLMGLKLVKNAIEGTVLSSFAAGFLSLGGWEWFEEKTKKLGISSSDFSRWIVRYMIERTPQFLTYLQWERVQYYLDNEREEKQRDLKLKFLETSLGRFAVDKNISKEAYQTYVGSSFQEFYKENYGVVNYYLSSKGVLLQPFSSPISPISPILKFEDDHIGLTGDMKKLEKIVINPQNITPEVIAGLHTLQTFGEKFKQDNSITQVIYGAYTGGVEVKESVDTRGIKTFTFSQNNQEVMTIKVDEKNDKMLIVKGDRRVEMNYDPVVEASFETLIPEKREEARDELRFLYLPPEHADIALDPNDKEDKAMSRKLKEMPERERKKAFWHYLMKKQKKHKEFVGRVEKKIIERRVKRYADEMKQLDKKYAKLYERYFGVSPKMVKVRLTEMYELGFELQLFELGEYKQYYNLFNEDIFKWLFPLDTKTNFDVGRWLLSSYILKYLAGQENLEKYEKILGGWGVNVENLKKQLEEFKSRKAEPHEVMLNKEVREAMRKVSGKELEDNKNLLDYKALPLYSTYVTYYVEKKYVMEINKEGKEEKIKDRTPEEKEGILGDLKPGEILLYDICMQKWSNFMLDDPFVGLSEKEVADVNKLFKKMEKAEEKEKEKYKRAFYGYVIERYIVRGMKHLEMERIRYLKVVKLMKILGNKYKDQFKQNKSIKQLLASDITPSERKALERMRSDLATLNQLLPKKDKFNVYETKLSDVKKRLDELGKKYNKQAQLIDMQISGLTSIEIEVPNLSNFSHLFVKEGSRVVQGQPVILLAEKKFKVVLPGKSEFEEDVLEQTESMLKRDILTKASLILKGDPFAHIQEDAKKAIYLWYEISKLEKSKQRLKKVSEKSVKEGGSKIADKRILKWKKEIEKINKVRMALGLKPIDENFYKKFKSVKGKLAKDKPTFTKEDVLILGEVMDLHKLDNGKVDPLENPEKYAELLSKNKKYRENILNSLGSKPPNTQSPTPPRS